MTGWGNRGASASLTLGLIGGSGLEDWRTDGDGRGDGSGNGRFEGEPDRIHEPDSPWGPPSDPVSEWRIAGRRILFLPRHGRDHRHPPHRVNYRANIHCLRELGADVVLAVNTVGGIGAAFTPGRLAVPDQLIDYTWGRAQTFHDGPDPEASPTRSAGALFGTVQHVEFGKPFDPGWRARLLAVGRAQGLDLEEGGCIGVTQGPRLETAAEIERLARDGCDMVNMTALPEAALAREAGLPYACLAVVANPAAGRGDGPIELAAIESTVRGALARVRRLLDALFRDGDGGGADH